MKSFQEDFPFRNITFGNVNISSFAILPNCGVFFFSIKEQSKLQIDTFSSVKESARENHSLENFSSGISVSKPYAHLPQPLPGDISISGNRNLNDDRTAIISSNFDATGALPSSQHPRSHFVPNPAGIGQRTSSKRETFKRTNRVDASSDDLFQDPQQYTEQNRSPQQPQQQYEYKNPSSNFYAPQHSNQPSRPRSNTPTYTSGTTTNHPNARYHASHVAQDSRQLSGYDSGVSTGDTNYNPRNYPSIPTARVPLTVEPYDVPPPIPIPRRKSLPSIVKIKPGDYKIDETARSSDNLQEKETFIIENGIRKRVTEQAPTYTESGTPLPQATVMTSSTGSPTLARRVILESVTRVDAPTSTASGTGGNKRGSMPTLVNLARKRQAAPSKDLFLDLFHIAKTFLSLS